VQAPGDPAATADGLLLAFVTAYQTLGIPFTLGAVVAGVSLVLTVRWTSTFVVRWLRGVLVVEYTRELQTRAFDNALDARIEYFDRQASDDILNAILTQAEYAGRAIEHVINFLEQGLLSLIYLGIAFVLAPFLTVFSIVFLGGFSLLFRYVLESGYDIGDRVANANERVQQAAQAGTQGIRDTKLFGLKQKLFDGFLGAVEQFGNSSIKQRRVQQAIQNFYNLLTAISVFLLIYLVIAFADKSLSSLGVFLFAMFRLGPKVSGHNSKLYQVVNNLLTWSEHKSSSMDSDGVVNRIRRQSKYRKKCNRSCLTTSTSRIEGRTTRHFPGSLWSSKRRVHWFRRAVWGWEINDRVVAGSALRTQFGEIRANGRSIHEMPIDGWRDRVAVVRQDPFIFNDTLRYNLTVGNRDVSEAQLDKVVRIAKIEEPSDDLPDGYVTQLGDNGVRLSGGQKQRVALKRALLKDADILVLDEATSDLDSSLEMEVQQSIESLNRDYAMVGIAHRLSTVQNADRIYTIDSGRIIDTGGHDELIAAGGQYADLYAIQSQEA
jgi:subfamily B ATP-binding cassette protein MsbA